MRLFEAATILTVTLCSFGIAASASAQVAAEPAATEPVAEPAAAAAHDVVTADTAQPSGDTPAADGTGPSESPNVALVAPSTTAAHMGGHVSDELAVVPHGNADIWALASFSVASLGGSLAFFISSDSTADELAETDGPLLFDRSERIRLDQKRESQRNLGWVLLGTGAATGIGAIWLSIDRRNDDRDATVSVAPTNFGRRPGLVVSGRW